MITRSIGLRIKELRYKTGMSQERFANSINMARTYLAEVEAGKRNISAKNLEKISHGFDIGIREFFDSDLFDER